MAQSISASLQSTLDHQHRILQLCAKHSNTTLDAVPIQLIYNVCRYLQSLPLADLEIPSPFNHVLLVVTPIQAREGCHLPRLRSSLRNKRAPHGPHQARNIDDMQQESCCTAPTPPAYSLSGLTCSQGETRHLEHLQAAKIRLRLWILLKPSISELRSGHLLLLPI